MLLLAVLAGCAQAPQGPSAEELAHMVTTSRGAISGVVVDRANRTLGQINVKLFATSSGEQVGEVETGSDGTFYFQRLLPTQYRVSVDLKDWTDCIVKVSAGRFSNLTITQPVYPQKPRSC